MTAPQPPPLADANSARPPASTGRWVLAVAVAGTVFIALGAFWLSFTSLSDLARRAGIAADRAWVWPLIVDGVIVVATVSVVALTGHGRRAARYPWALLTAGAAVSVLANASHAIVAADTAVPSVLAAAVAAVPPVVLLAITHLTVELTHPPNAVDGRKAEVTTSGVSQHRALSAGTVRRNATVRLAADRTNEAAREALRLRAETTWTNRQIAAQLGVHPSTVGRWFRSHTAPAPSAGPAALHAGSGSQPDGDIRPGVSERER